MDETQTHPQAEQVPAIPPSHKRQIDSDSDDEPMTKRARLTRKNLALFDKMGSKNTSDTTDDSNSTGTTSTTMSGFAIQARKNGILDPLSSKPPRNLEHLRIRLARSRETASPSESAYGDYVDQVGRAQNEAAMLVKTSARLLKEYPKGYDQAFKQAFTGLPEDVGFNNGLSAPQPDFVEGLYMEKYLPFPVDERICGAVLYEDDPQSLTLPHVAGEWKGPGEDMEEARTKAAYDGAALVYARDQALDAAKEPYLTGHAKVTTFTTDGRHLNIFAHYAVKTEGGTPEYHQYPIRSLILVDSHQGYKEGRKQLRNAQDLAREESYALRDQLKDYWRQPRDSLHPIAERVPPLSVPDLEPLDTAHVFEDEDDYEVVKPRPVYQPTPPASSRPKHGQKRKAQISLESSSVSSRYRSKLRSYWKKDVMSGRHYHKHSDGTVSWLDDEEDEHD
ncbi:hypothetical protein Neosp_003086 [[Neocosmospora] mangrovei]